MEFLSAAAAWADGSWRTLSAARPEILVAATAATSAAATWTAARMETAGVPARIGTWILVMAAGTGLLLAATSFSPVFFDPTALADSQRVRVAPD